MVDRVAPPASTRPIIDATGNMEPSFRAFTQKITRRALIIGSGSPEGVIEASQGALYLDEDASAGDVLYVKRLADISGDTTQGWRAI